MLINELPEIVPVLRPYYYLYLRCNFGRKRHGGFMDLRLNSATLCIWLGICGGFGAGFMPCKKSAAFHSNDDREG